MDIGTSGIMRNYMARKCDIHFPLDHKLRRFLTAAMRVYKVPEEEQAKVLAFIRSLNIRAIATEVMYKLFAMLEMTFDFKLSKGDEQVTSDKTWLEIRYTKQDPDASWLQYSDYRQTHKRRKR